MFIRIILFLKRNDSILLALVSKPDMKLLGSTKVRYLYYRTTSNLLLVYPVLDDRVDKLLNPLSLYRITLGDSEITSLLVNSTSLQQIDAISWRGHDFILKYP